MSYTVQPTKAYVLQIVAGTATQLPLPDSSVIPGQPGMYTGDPLALLEEAQKLAILLGGSFRRQDSFDDDGHQFFIFQPDEPRRVYLVKASNGWEDFAGEYLKAMGGIGTDGRWGVPPPPN